MQSVKVKICLQKVRVGSLRTGDQTLEHALSPF